MNVFLRKARARNGHVEATLNHPFPAQVLLAPIKSLGRAFSKVHEKYGGRYDGLTDLVRGTLQCATLGALEAAARLLAASDVLRVVRVKNRLKASFDADAVSGGYRDVLTNVKVGHVVAEVQLNLEAFVEIKEGSGHAVYEAARVIHFFDPVLKAHYGTPGSLLEVARPRCEDDDDLPLCVAERASSGQLQSVSLVGDAREGAAFSRSLVACIGQKFCRLKDLVLDNIGGLPRLDAIFSPDAICALRSSLGSVDIGRCPGDLGPIPRALGDLARCTHIRFSALRISGSVPFDALAGLRELQGLEVDDCELGGPLVVDDGATFPKLSKLSLARGHLSGPVPPALGDKRRFPRLADLRLAGNDFEGEPPAALFDDNALEKLDLSGNKLRGPEPTLGDVGARSKLSTLKTEENAWDAPSTEGPTFAEKVAVAAAVAAVAPPAFTASDAGNAELNGGSRRPVPP